MEYPSNSKDPIVPTSVEKPKIEPIALSTAAVRRKKSLSKRLHDTFVGGDDARSVGSYLVMDVLIPAAKDTVVDVVTQGIERMIFGEARPGVRRTVSNNRGEATRVAYNRFGGNPVQPNNPRQPVQAQLSRHARANHDFGEIELGTRVEAEEVINTLATQIAQYGSASVNDLYLMINITGDFTDENYGWEDLAGAHARRTRGGGYILNLPKPVPLP